MVLSALVAVLLTVGEPAHAAASTTTPGSASKALGTAPALDPGQNPRDFDNPPPGASVPDQALWRRAYDANNAVLLAYSRGTRLQSTANTSAYGARLDLLAKRSPADEARARDLRAQLEAAWARDVAVLLEQWPVDKTRACRYPLQLFDSALLSDEHPRKRAQMDDARRSLEECVGYAEAAVAYATRANDDLQRALAELDRALVGIPIAPSSEAGEEAPPAGRAGGGAPS